MNIRSKIATISSQSFKSFKFKAKSRSKVRIKFSKISKISKTSKISKIAISAIIKSYRVVKEIPRHVTRSHIFLFS